METVTPNKRGGLAGGGRAEDVQIFYLGVDRIRNWYSTGTVQVEQIVKGNDQKKKIIITQQC